MLTITKQNPLMQPVQYKGQVYFTSQYFHAQYKANLGGKYALLKNFHKLLRSIEAYQTYVDSGDIVELTWAEAKKSGVPIWIPLFKTNTYNPLVLINAVAQIALSHHLDDEISKSISVAVNTKAATEAVADMKYISQQAKAALSLAKLFGMKGNQALLGANRATRKVTGVAPLELLDLTLVAESKEKLLTPTEVGFQLGCISAIKVNRLLEEQGFQVSLKSSKNAQWQPTEKGKPYGDMLDTDKKHANGTPVKQWKWYPSIILQLKGLEV